jgi:hypothetical protein
VKWFADVEVIGQLCKFWPCVNKVIENEDDFSPTHRENLRKILQEAGNTLELELALAYDVGIKLLRLCYLSEGDGVLAPMVFDDIKSVYECINYKPNGFVPMENLPTLRAVCGKQAVLADPSATEEKQAEIYTSIMRAQFAKLEPLREEFTHQFYGKHNNLLQVWKFCRLFSVPFVKSISELKLLDEITKSVPSHLCAQRESLQRSASLYKVQADIFKLGDSTLHDRQSEFRSRELLSFWQQNSKLLPKWFEMFKFVALLQPSSAAAERSFALLRRNFNGQQQSTLEDYKAGSMTIRFNTIQRKQEHKREEESFRSQADVIQQPQVRYLLDETEGWQLDLGLTS